MVYELFDPQLHILVFLSGSPGIIDSQLSQKHVGLQYTVWWPYQDVTRPKSRFESTLLRSLRLLGEQECANSPKVYFVWVVWGGCGNWYKNLSCLKNKLIASKLEEPNSAIIDHCDHRRYVTEGATLLSVVVNTFR